MIGKIFEIGYTLRKKMPVLIRDVDDNNEKWAYIYYLNHHLFDLTMRGYKDDIRLNSLLIYSHCDFANQHNREDIICRAYFPMKQIKNTHIKFIPLINLYSHTLPGCVGQKWKSSSLTKKNQ